MTRLDKHNKDVCKPWTETGSDLFFFLTCLHTATFILLSIFSLLETISLEFWETLLSWLAKRSLPVAFHGSLIAVLVDTELEEFSISSVFILCKTAYVASIEWGTMRCEFRPDWPHEHGKMLALFSHQEKNIFTTLILHLYKVYLLFC